MVLNWGICGTGLIAQDFCNALSIDRQNHKIAAVASRELEKAQKFSESFGCSASFDSYDKLATAPGIDVVYVSTLTHLHYDNVKMFLNAGKNVLCEKPLAIKSAQVAELISLAREKKLFLMEGIWSRFFPAYTKIRETLRSGSLGPIRLVVANFCSPGSFVPRLNRKDMGGCALLDFGVYLVQFADWIFGPEKPIKITASGCLFADSGVDRSGSMTLIYPGDRMAVLTYSMDCGLFAEAQIVGEKSQAKLGPLVWAPVELSIGEEKYSFPTPTGPKKWNFWECGGLLYEANHVKECLDQGRIESPILPDADCLRIHEMMDAVLLQLGVSYD